MLRCGRVWPASYRCGTWAWERKECEESGVVTHGERAAIATLVVARPTG